MKKNVILLVTYLLAQVWCSALEIPAIFSSDMVLQRNATVNLWGWAKPNEKIEVKATWIEEDLIVFADSIGNFSVKLKTTDSREAQRLEICSNDSSAVLKNVLFGEVWLCSGQSNMEWPLKTSSLQQGPTSQHQMAKLKANHSDLRLFTVHRNNSKVPLKDIQKYTRWQAANADSIDAFSAVAYHFGQQLQEVLDVPVGMIQSSFGGSKIEAWMSQEVIEQYQELNFDFKLNPNSRQHPTILYNAMIHPLIPFTIKGVLWYQGESNRKQSDLYKKLFPSMVSDWRSRWGIGDFPIYYAQIAPFDYSKKDKTSNINNNSAFIREAQLECVHLIPNSGLAVLSDIGAKENIHPANKLDVANRLLFNALHYTYGFENIDAQSPTYRSISVNDSVAILSFDHAETGLHAMGELLDFEIAGDDKIFYPAFAKIVNDSIIMVKSDNVHQPRAVRYGWKDWFKGTLYDKNLLPASSFRTDDWDDAIRYEDSSH